MAAKRIQKSGPVVERIYTNKNGMRKMTFMVNGEEEGIYDVGILELDVGVSVSCYAKDNQLFIYDGEQMSQTYGPGYFTRIDDKGAAEPAYVDENGCMVRGPEQYSEEDSYYDIKNEEVIRQVTEDFINNYTKIKINSEWEKR